MSSKYERFARIDGIDLETGIFPMTSATEGEASDGHILSIKGGRVPEWMPLQISHWNDPTATLGSVTHPQKDYENKPARLRQQGQIEMDGIGVPLQVRQDLAHMMSRRHIRSVSIKWDEVDGKPPVRRVNLPKDHPAFVDEGKEKSWRKRMGLYFEHWDAREVSIVALGADKQALIGRAEETDGDVSTFWRAMAEQAAESQPEEPEPEEKIATALAGLRVQIADCRQAGAHVTDVNDALWAALDEEEQSELLGRLLSSEIEGDEDTEAELQELREQLEAAEQRAIAAEAALVEVRKAPDQEPAPPARKDPTTSLLALDAKDLRKPVDVQALGRMLSKALDEADARRAQTVQNLLDLATGKVSK